MFDEVDEGNRGPEKSPPHRNGRTGTGLLADAGRGTAPSCPSDWYLRLAGEITRMFHGRKLSRSRSCPRIPARPAKSKKQ